MATSGAAYLEREAGSTERQVIDGHGSMRQVLAGVGS